MRKLGVGRPEAARSRRGRERSHSCFLHRTRRHHRCLPWHSLLKQQLRRLHSRVSVKTLHHHIAFEDVGKSDEGHPLMVGEIGAHHRAFSAPGRRPPTLGCCRGSRRNRLVETVLAFEPESGKPPEVPGRSSGSIAQRARWHREPRPARLRDLVSARGRALRKLCTGRCRANGQEIVGGFLAA